MLKGYEIAKLAAAHKPLLIDRESRSSLELVRQLVEKERFLSDEVDFFASSADQIDFGGQTLGLGERMRMSKLLNLCHFSQREIV